MLQQVYFPGHTQNQYLLWPPFLPVLCCQWLEPTETHISLTNFKRQLSEQHTPVACAPAGIFHWSPPKPIPPLASFPSSSLLPMTGTNCENHWSWRLISPSLPLSTSCQSSSQIAASVHSPSVNSPSNYLILILLFIFLLCTPVLAHLSSAHLSLQCLIAIL